MFRTPIGTKYTKAYEKYGVSHKTLAWKSKQAQLIRFKQLIDGLEIKGKHVLDVGCGFGDLVDYLEKVGKAASYTGVDITPQFIDKSKKHHPEHSFYCCDYFKHPVDESFDIIICNGVLNGNVEDVINVREKAIEVMFDHANEVVAFTMAGSHHQPENKDTNRVWYADSIEITVFCASLTKKLVLKQQYRPKDFTIQMFK